MDSVLQLPNIFVNVTASDAAMDFHIEIVAQSKAHLLRLLSQLTCWAQNKRLRVSDGRIDPLKSTKTEDTSLSCATLRLYNHITFVNDGNDGTLLHCRWLIEPVVVGT